MTSLRNSTSKGRRSALIVVLIERTQYLLRAVACDEGIGQSAFRLMKPDGTVYDVVETTFGPECDCPDFIFRRDGLDPAGCKHIQALHASGLL